MTSNSKSLWERTVELTVHVGERVLAPIERWIGRRSLVGDATFFPLERFPWVPQIEQNWTVIRDEVMGLLEDREALPNFQEISKDQIGITDDDRWKTVFLYGYGFEAKLRVVLCVDVLRPLPEPESTINRAIVKAISYSPFVLDAKRNQQAWERRFQERRRERALAGAGVQRAA